MNLEKGLACLVLMAISAILLDKLPVTLVRKDNIIIRPLLQFRVRNAHQANIKIRLAKFHVYPVV